MRRRFARRIGRPIGGIMRAGIPPLLLRANQLFASGNYAEAADSLEQLARDAEARVGRRAPRLYLEAGRARLLSGQSQAGMVLLRRGLELFAAAGRSHRLARIGLRLVSELNELGLKAEAEQIRRSLDGFGIAPADGMAAGPQNNSRGALPTHCPGCGAPVHPDEVEWLDAVTAECEYCGTPMRSAQAS